MRSIQHAALRVFVGLGLLWVAGRPVQAQRPAPDDAAGFAAHVAALEAADDAESALRLAQGFGRRGQPKAALRWAAEAERRGAMPLRVELVRGDIAAAAADWPAAIAAYYEVARQAPRMEYAHTSLWHALRQAPANGLAGLVDVARVRAVLERAGYFVPSRFGTDGPGTTETFTEGPATAEELRAGYAALKRADAEEAVRTFRQVLSRAPLDAEAWRGLGAAEVRAGHASRARAAYALFLSLGPPANLDTLRVRRLLTDDARRRGLSARPPSP